MIFTIILFAVVGVLIFLTAKERAEEKKLYLRKVEALEKVADELNYIRNDKCDN